MSVAIPSSMEVVVQRAGVPNAVLDEVSLGSELIKAAPDPKTISEEERRGAFSEIAAWRFMRPHGSVQKNEPWSIYWGPLGSGILADGKTPFYSPDVAELADDILSHWIFWAGRPKHPLRKARYARLALE